MKARCEWCVYWYKEQCRAHPPVKLVFADCILTLFPVTLPEEWCGEYKAGPNAPKPPATK